MVNSLLNVDDRSWDVSLVQDMFNVRDANLILGIPLSFSATNDHWAWVGEKSGHYSVKSAYNLLQNQKNSRSGENNSGFWRKLWHLKIPPKVKNFMWRAVSNVFLPVFSSSLRGCWQKADIVTHANFVGTIEHFLYDVFHGFDEDISCRVVMLCWSIWKARNSLVWDKKASSPSHVVSSAWTTLDHWLNAQDKTSLLSSSLIGDGNNFEHWTKPAYNTIKINVDGAIFEKDNAYGFGIVACDSEGRIIDFVAKYYHGSYSPEAVEALGVKEALSWLKDKGWNMVEVETDSLLTVQAVSSNQQMSSVFGLIAHDCKILLSSLPNVSFCFVRRSVNKIVHFVARRSCFYSDRNIHDVDILTDFSATL
ncbi:uncharacterized protein LOC115704315 [Cannabis sativa]|uniref:uncharacterized protein LOC115704315 n=1 Tax=Cannabis sativa TaxID=3483 RepID=UPI0011DF6DAD|nr:uncharacterized protein LOC115704315 [Cannabis sativa]